MKCINFDRAFERYMAEWMKKNSEKYKDDMDVIEDMMPDVYLEFLKNRPIFWMALRRRIILSSLTTPICSSAGFAITSRRAYPCRICCLERRHERWANPAEKSLLALVARDRFAGRDADDGRFACSAEMESQAPMQRYIDYIASLEEPSDKGDLCAEALLSMGEAVVDAGAGRPFRRRDRPDAIFSRMF